MDSSEQVDEYMFLPWGEFDRGWSTQREAFAHLFENPMMPQ